MKIFFSTIFIFVNCLCFAGSVTEPLSIGEWSEPTNGLRGRLLFAERTNNWSLATEGIVYLELQNISPSDTLYVYYNFQNSAPICELHDDAGKMIKNRPDTGSDWLPSSCWLSLPNDSTLRFQTGGSNSEPNHPCLYIISKFFGGKWEIPLTATNDYYLSGTFSSLSTTNGTRPRVWEGTLKLPPVKIPVKSSDAKL
jgi:hypothetical protein